MNLKDGLIVDSRGYLQRLVASITESPRAADSETGRRGLKEDIGDLVPLTCQRSHMHHSIGIETVEEEWRTIKDEFGSSSLHKSS